MSRHRNVRSMRYSDEYDGYDDVYGHSVEDDYSISPSDAAFMYDRSSRQAPISSFLTSEEDIVEEDEPLITERQGNDKRSYLSDLDQAKLISCLEEVRNVLGDSIPEPIIIDVIISSNFDCAVTLDKLLNNASAPNTPEMPKPQRAAIRRRERGDETGDSETHDNLLEYESDEDEDENNWRELLKANLNEEYLDVETFLNESVKKTKNIKLDDCVKNKKEIFKKDNIVISNDVISSKTDEEITLKFEIRSMSVEELKKSVPSKIGYFICKRLTEINSSYMTKYRTKPDFNIVPFSFVCESQNEVFTIHRK